MAQNQKTYDNEFKAQAVKLVQEIGGEKATGEMFIAIKTDDGRIKGKIFLLQRASRFQAGIQ